MTTKPLHEVADAVRSLKRFTDAITTLGEFVEDASSAEQAAGEANVRLATKRDEEAAQDARLRALSDAIALAESDVARSKSEALAVAAKGRSDAGVALRDAEREANRIIADAKAEAERLKGPLNSDIGRLQAQIAELQDAKGTIDASVLDAKSTLDALTGQISQARKTIAALLKG